MACCSACARGPGGEPAVSSLLWIFVLILTRCALYACSCSLSLIVATVDGRVYRHAWPSAVGAHLLGAQLRDAERASINNVHASAHVRNRSTPTCLPAAALAPVPWSWCTVVRVPPRLGASAGTCQLIVRRARRHTCQRCPAPQRDTRTAPRPWAGATCGGTSSAMPRPPRCLPLRSRAPSCVLQLRCSTCACLPMHGGGNAGWRAHG